MYEYILKIIVILTAVLIIGLWYAGFSKTQCESIKFIELKCQESNYTDTLSGKYDVKYDDIIYQDIPNQSIENFKAVENNKHKNHSELNYIIMAVVTLLFSLFYYTYQKITHEYNLLTLLEDKDDNLDIISSQTIRIKKLEEEVDELIKSGMEMHTLLHSTLESSAKSTEKLNILKDKLANSENLITVLTQKNFDKTTELEKKNDIIKSLKADNDEITIKNISLIKDNSKISSQLEQILTKSKLKESKLLSEISNFRFEFNEQINALITAKNEAIQFKDALQEILINKFNQIKTNKFLSLVKLTSEIKSSNQICERYKQKLDESLKLNHQYLDSNDALKSDIEKLENNYSKLEEEKEEIENKLITLTKFFKEQEKEYLKQINGKALLCDNKEGEFSEHIKSLNQEIINYKLEIQSLKKEIIDQEASFKIQVFAADKKASDCWISFRQAERKVKEMELETGQLRHKLTKVNEKFENSTKSINSSKDFEDELLDIPLPTFSPDFTLLDFEPPAPILTPFLIQHFSQTFPSSIQHASANQRLFPHSVLGRVSSTPLLLSRRYNKSLSPCSPLSPSGRSSIFRSLPKKYNYMNCQNKI